MLRIEDGRKIEKLFRKIGRKKGEFYLFQKQGILMKIERSPRVRGVENAFPKDEKGNEYPETLRGEKSGQSFKKRFC